MASTLAQLKSRLRVEGRDIAITGTASGGSASSVVATILAQADDYWKDWWCHIETTGDGNAPEGESRKVISSSQSGTSVTTDPYSAAVEPGDTFSLAVFSDSELKDLLNQAVLDLSRYKPEYTTSSLSIVANTKRYDPPADYLRIDRIVYINSSTQEEREYGFTVEKHQEKIALDAYPSEAKTATVYYTKKHTQYTTDGSTSTVEEEDEGLLLLYARAQMCLARLSDTSKLVKYQIGNVMEDFSAAAKSLQNEYDALVKAYRAGVSNIFVGFNEETPRTLSVYQDWPLPHPFDWMTP